MRCWQQALLTSIKSGPNTINDTQVQAMTRAIIDNHAHWLQQTRKNYSGLGEVDIVVGFDVWDG